MTPPSQRAVLAREPNAAADPVTRPARRFDGGPVWMRVVPPAVTLAAMLWGITGSSYWRDESATLAAVHRPFAQLVRMLGHVDAVHGAYYVIMWPLVRVAGSSPLVTRFPSALAMAVAAALVAALGRRLVSPATGLAAGLVFAVLPAVSLYGQDARSYGMVTALATGASYLLVRLIMAPSGRRRWLAGYWACLSAVGILNFFGLLLIAAHAVTVMVACLRERDRRARRSLALCWLAAAAGAVLLTSPVVLLAWTERSQLAWLNAPRISTIAGLEQLVGSGQMPVGLAIILVCGLLASALSGRAALRRGWPVMLPALAVPWLAVPPVLLLAASALTPLYTFRYVLFCVPGGALLAGAGLAAIGRAAATGFGRDPAGAVSTGLRALGWAACAAALAVVTALGLGTQLSERGPAGHEDNIRRADQIVAANMRPGDAVIYDTPADENLTAAYPYGLVRLTNIAQYQSPIASGTLAGTTLPAPAVRQRIAGVSRLWVVEVHHRTRLPVLQGLGLRQLRIWHTADLWLFLYATR
jgi:mannosyltransferase